MPPLRLPSWEHLAIETYLGPPPRVGDAPPLPTLRTNAVEAALADYDRWMARFAKAREVLIWGTPAFTQRLRLVVSDVFTS